MWDGTTVKLEMAGRNVALMTMNRPEALNALNEEMLCEMMHAVRIFEESDQARVMVITGAGRAFSAGGDIDLLYSMDSPIEAKRIFKQSQEMVRTIYDCPKLVIAAVNGFVAGASTSLMMACDQVIAADEARIGFSFINVAFCPDSGCSHFLTQRAGYHLAFDILAQGRFLSAAEALELRLINKITPSDTVLSTALNQAEGLSNSAYRTLLMNKYILREAQGSSFHQAAELESLHQILAWSSNDFKEGCRAFSEKRKPVFTGD